MSTPLLGWIAPQDRTQEQQDAHAQALAAMPRFALAPVQLAKGDKVILTKFFATPEVMADIGFLFDGFHQLTGSCVGASDGNVIATVAAVQRMLSAGATKAFVPFWPFSYGRTRFIEGDRGQGEGAVDSVMGTQNTKEGIIDISVPGLPAFSHSDGLLLTEHLEMQFSDGASKAVVSLLNAASTTKYPVGTRSPIYDTDSMATAIVNGYPILTGCDYYCGHGHIKGSGDLAYCTGTHDAQGGHSTAYVGVWEHPNDGRLFLYWNQWPKDTYPADPASGLRCAVWHTEAEVAKRFKHGAGNGETMALSHLSYMPAQADRILDWMQA